MEMRLFEHIRRLMKCSAVKNGLWLYVLQMFNTVIPLITLPYITRILGAEEYGIFSIAFNLIGYFMVIVEYGFGMSGARKASLSTNIQDLNTTFTAIILSRALLCFICFVSALGYSNIFMQNEKQRGCLILLFLIPLGTVLQQNWLFQGLQRMKYITIASVVARIISLICIFGFVKTSNDLSQYCIFYASTTIIVGIVGTYFALHKIKVKFVKLSWRDVLAELKDGWYVFTTSLSSKIFNTFGITVMGIMVAEYYVGIYSAIQKIPQMILLIWSPISQVLYPIASQKMTFSYKDGRRYVKRIEKIILPIFLLLIILVGFFAKPFIRIAFGQEYAAYYYIIYPLLFWLVFGILNNFNGIQTLLAGGYSKEYSRCFLFGVVFNVVFNIVFVKLWGIIGAALAPALSEFLFGLLLVRRIHLLDKKGARNDV